MAPTAAKAGGLAFGDSPAMWPVHHRVKPRKLKPMPAAAQPRQPWTRCLKVRFGQQLSFAGSDMPTVDSICVVAWLGLLRIELIACEKRCCTRSVDEVGGGGGSGLNISRTDAHGMTQGKG